MADDKKDPMASAIQKAGGGAPPDQVAKDEAARLSQEDIDRKAAARSSAITEDERATLAKMDSDRKEREKLRPGAPVIVATSAERARPGEATVTMIFPRAMFIWAEPDEKHPSRHKVAFDKGAQQVPESLADNWYLRASGVERYDGGTPGRARREGPTVEEWVAAGYSASNYPPSGYASRSTPEAIQAMIDKERSA